jgi:histidinol dehydrogenase
MMKRAKGFNEASQLLTRTNTLEHGTPPGLAAHIRQAFGRELSVQEVVDRIIGKVRDEGDEALFGFAQQLDGVLLNSLETDRQEVVDAYDITDSRVISALEFAARRIRDFHLACGHKVGVFPVGKHLSQRVQPLRRVGLYVPGGSAAYPSTVLMMAIPAKVAGVEEIIMLSPPGADGRIPAATLVAADIAKVSRVFKIGGAQAIAAMAFGTESVPRVDKICGPGNIFVTTAKKTVYGTVGIDGLEGPSELMIVADEKANPVLCAADLLAQAEHDPMTSVILVTTSADLADRIDKEIQTQLKKLKRHATVQVVVDKGLLAVVDNMSQAIDLVNLFAPEHLSLMISDPAALVSEVRNAGCIFLGDNSPVVLGDYVAGPSHVLPTGGSARFGSPLGIADFLKVTNIIAVDGPAIQELGQPAAVIAQAEGFDAHARAVERRLK